MEHYFLGKVSQTSSNTYQQTDVALKRWLKFFDCSVSLTFPNVFIWFGDYFTHAPSWTIGRHSKKYVAIYYGMDARARWGMAGSYVKDENTSDSWCWLYQAVGQTMGK
jgi:hypothetical protein